MSSKDISEKTLETVTISKTSKWSMESESKQLNKFLKKWIKLREVSDEFCKIHYETLLSTLYISRIVKEDDALNMLDYLKKDLVGGNQSLDNKLWGFREKLFIVLPNNKNIITSALLRNLLKLAAMTKTPAQFSDKDLIESSDQNSFWSGFFSELYSTSPIKRIAPITDKTSAYANGVSAMRFELYNTIRKTASHIKGCYWTDADYSISGNPTKKTKKYLAIFLGTYVNGSLLGRTIGLLIESYFKALKDAIVKRFDFPSFLKDGKSTLALLNRYKIEKVAVGKGKKSKTSSKKLIIKPTKPSRLATILACERASISELSESAWINLEEHKKEFDKTLPLKRNYDSFVSRAKELIDEQWAVKQIVLNASKVRQGALDLPKETSANKKILELRKITSSEEVPRKELLKDFTALYVTLFAKLKIIDDKGFTVPDLEDFYSSQFLKKRYPITHKLIEEFLTIKSSMVRAESQKKELLKE